MPAQGAAVGFGSPGPRYLSVIERDIKRLMAMYKLISRWKVRGRVHTQRMALSLALFAAMPAPSLAMTLYFQSITSGGVTNHAADVTQLFVEVTNPADSGHNALFTFRNTAPLGYSITDIYFDDGLVSTLNSIAGIANGPGVLFSVGASPSGLPGGAILNPVFTTTPGIAASANVPSPRNGVNPGESLSLLLKLQEEKSFSDVQAELQNGDLRIGLRVQGFHGGGSSSFINTAAIVPEIPEPSTLALWVFGALLIASALRASRPCGGIGAEGAIDRKRGLSS